MRHEHRAPVPSGAPLAQLGRTALKAKVPLSLGSKAAKGAMAADWKWLVQGRGAEALSEQLWDKYCIVFGNAINPMPSLRVYTMSLGFK